jgi:Xaa-Pro aminopeptidase
MSRTPSPEPYIQKRVENLSAALHAYRPRLPQDAAFLVTNFVDVSWLTGFEGDDSYALVMPNGAVHLISDTRYEEQIGNEAAWTKTLIRRKGMTEEVAKLLKRLKVKNLAVQAEAMTLRGLGAFKKAFRENKLHVRTIPVAEVLIKLRHIKDEREIAITEKAIAIAEDAFLALKGRIKPGQSENEIAGLLGYEMRKGGALNSSFDSIVGAGANGSLPHYRPGDVKLQANSPLLVDWGARYRGYCSDLTRVLFVGSVPPKIREIYRIVLDAQLAAIEAIKPGAHGKKVDKVARDIITKAGYGKQFGHGTGHGLGRDIHEAISLSRLSTTTLEPGMIITVEPGIYLPGLGGVRIEEDVRVTSGGGGHRVLSSVPQDLAFAQI